IAVSGRVAMERYLPEYPGRKILILGPGHAEGAIGASAVITVRAGLVAVIARDFRFQRAVLVKLMGDADPQLHRALAVITLEMLGAESQRRVIPYGHRAGESPGLLIVTDVMIRRGETRILLVEETRDLAIQPERSQIRLAGDPPGIGAQP